MTLSFQGWIAIFVAIALLGFHTWVILHKTEVCGPHVVCERWGGITASQTRAARQSPPEPIPDYLGTFPPNP